MISQLQWEKPQVARRGSESEDPTVTEFDKIRREQSLRAIEGYLDLAMGTCDQFSLNESLRDNLADRALEILDKLPTLRQDRAQTYFLRGQAYRIKEQHRDAVKQLEKAVALNADEYLFHLALAWCYKRCGRLDLAIQVLDDALDVEPDKAIIHYNLACYWSLAHETHRALQFLMQSFDLDPSFRDLVPAETDFDPIREDPEFRALTSVVV